jgi:hypothetical protein
MADKAGEKLETALAAIDGPAIEIVAMTRERRSRAASAIL